jgi:DNA-binding XRE family transcriptional regulator
MRCYYMENYRKIKELHMKEELKQLDLAKKACISNTCLLDIEVGQTIPYLKILLEISQVLHIDCNIFQKGTPTMKGSEKTGCLIIEMKY